MELLVAMGSHRDRAFVVEDEMGVFGPLDEQEFQPPDRVRMKRERLAYEEVEREGINLIMRSYGGIFDY